MEGEGVRENKIEESILPESKEERFDVAEYKKKEEEYQETRQELEPEKEEKEWFFEPKIGEFSFEDKIRSERRLDNLGKILEGADFDWNLDGGLNIPIYKGEYYRRHKDIEISISQEDLEKAYLWFKEQGYNLFDLTSIENPRKLSPDDLGDIEKYHTLVLSDVEKERGEVHNEKEIELHVHKRDKEGNQIVDDVILPKKYFENVPKYRTLSGYKVNLSHPMVIAFHKLKVERGDPFKPLERKLEDIRKSYDIVDLKELRAKLSDKDLVALEDLVVKQRSKRLQKADEKIEEIFHSLDLKASESEIYKTLREKMEIEKQERKARLRLENIAKEMTSYIVGNRDITFDDFDTKIKDIANLEEHLNRLEKKLEIVKKEKGSGEKEDVELPEEIDNLLTEEERIRYENLEEEKKEKEKILEAVKELFNESQEAKKQVEAKEVTEDEARAKIIEKANVAPVIVEYLSAHIEAIVDTAFESESEEDFIKSLGEKYRDEVEEKLEKKFSSKEESNSEPHGM